MVGLDPASTSHNRLLLTLVQGYVRFLGQGTLDFFLRPSIHEAITDIHAHNHVQEPTAMSIHGPYPCPEFRLRVPGTKQPKKPSKIAHFT